MSDPIAKTSPAAVPAKSLFDARDYVVRGEDPQQLEALAAGYNKRLQPNGPIERFMVVTMVLAQWNKQRWSRLEIAILSSTDDLLALLGDPAANKTLLLVQRRLTQEDRRYTRAFTDLRRLQKDRALAEMAQPPEESKLLAENWVRSVKTPERPHPATMPAPAPSIMPPVFSAGRP